MINLKEVITKYPECLESASKLHSYLVDLYPEEKRSITIITTIFDCGIAEEIKNNKDNIDVMTLTSYCNKLENEYAYSPKYSKECLNLWCDCFIEKKIEDKEIINNTIPSENNKRKASEGLEIKNNVLVGIGTCKDKDVVIPDGVTSIGYCAFTDCSSLTSIIIPDSVTSIGEDAFSGCKSLKHITIPDGVTRIENDTFSYCSSLTSITIPDSVTSIENSAFYNCNSLESVTIGNSVTSIENGAFHGCYSLENIVIPDGVTSIGYAAFENCSSLTHVTIPNCVKSIGNIAFQSCSKLTSVTIGNGVTSIGYYAFRCCDGLTTITIPDNVTSIGEGVFEDCNENLKIKCSEKIKELLKKTDNYKDSYVFLSATLNNTIHNAIENHIDLVEESNEYNEIKVGDIITLGTYPQGKNGEIKPIEWQVLDVNNGQAFVISKYALDCKPFNESYTSVTWETCSLRKWLNKDFYKRAFSNKDKTKIVIATVTADKNPRWLVTHQGNNTQDKVFLLSTKEANEYFKSDSARKCKGTDYCNNKPGAFTDRYTGCCVWWLRSSGLISYDADNFNSNGHVQEDSVSFPFYAVRPAMWIKI